MHVSRLLYSKVSTRCLIGACVIRVMGVTSCNSVDQLLSAVKTSQTVRPVKAWSGKEQRKKILRGLNLQSSFQIPVPGWHEWKPMWSYYWDGSYVIRVYKSPQLFGRVLRLHIKPVKSRRFLFGSAHDFGLAAGGKKNKTLAFSSHLALSWWLDFFPLLFLFALLNGCGRAQDFVCVQGSAAGLGTFGLRLCFKVWKLFSVLAGLFTMALCHTAFNLSGSPMPPHTAKTWLLAKNTF